MTTTDSTTSSTTTSTTSSATTGASRPFAVVTGASSGIGLELAKQFAEHGFDLLVVADDDLTEAASTLQELGAGVGSVKVDLAGAPGVEELVDAITATGRPVDALCLNAGVGESGPFTETKLEDDLRLISVNVVSAVHLAKRLVPAMVERGEGRILFTSSIASIAPAPNQALYGGSKSFLQSFAQALRLELQHTGVSVTSLMPGPTETNFFSRAALEHTALGAMKKDDAATVAQQGFEALMSGKQKVIAGGVLTRLQGEVAKAMPDSVKGAMQGLLSAPGTARKLPSLLKK
jgi:uncharacterized protein